VTAYRDDAEAVGARAQQLEDELAEARAKIARLEGRGPRPSGRADFLLGEPLRRRDEATLERPPDAVTLAALERVLRARTEHHVSVQGSSLEAHARGASALDGPKAVACAVDTRLTRRGILLATFFR
jgi:hypothetical protein